MTRKQTLLMIAVAGVLAGYGLVRIGSGPAAPVTALPTGSTTAAPAAEASGSNQLPPLPQPRGSSFSVVGNMSREEMVRRGILPAGAEAAPPAAGRVAGQAGSPVVGQAQQPPSSLRFPPEVGHAAASYLCLCGRQNRLDVCHCNDQPIGAVTMLAYLQKMMAADADPAALQAAMVDRYGPRVMVPTPGD